MSQGDALSGVGLHPHKIPHHDGRRHDYSLHYHFSSKDFYKPGLRNLRRMIIFSVLKTAWMNLIYILLFKNKYVQYKSNYISPQYYKKNTVGGRFIRKTGKIQTKYILDGKVVESSKDFIINLKTAT